MVLRTCILYCIILYVEYIGNIPAEKREEVIKQLNEESARLIQVYCPIIVYACSLHTFVLQLRNNMYIYIRSMFIRRFIDIMFVFALYNVFCL